MPRYDFRCKDCGKVYEAVRTFSQATDDTTCPHCQGTGKRIMASSYTVLSKSYTGWATRVEGTDWPWRDKTEENRTDEKAAEAELDEAESNEEKPAEFKPSNPASLSRYATIFDDKVGPKAETPAPKEEPTKE
ncbi:MAG: zinc ribbon domain-containing protein [Dehalococcoidia bacterium]|nr:zinc ribbon domain-containing protein [Dehalococcoidia bacterium]